MLAVRVVISCFCCFVVVIVVVVVGCSEVNMIHIESHDPGPVIIQTLRNAGLIDESNVDSKALNVVLVLRPRGPPTSLMLV